MARQILANQATAAKRRVYFHLVDATDGLTAETGEAGGQPQISTNGGAWTNTGIGTLTHIGNGRYYADLTQAAVATAGDIIETRYKSANTCECPGDSVHCVGYDPDDSAALGLSRIDAAITSRLAPTTAARTLDVSATGEAGLDFDNIKDASGAHTLTNITVPTVTSVTNRVTANVDQVDGAALGTHAAGMVPADVRDFGGAAGTFSGGRPEVNTTNVAGTAQTARDLGAQLDAAVSTRASQTSIDAVDDYVDTEVAAIKAKTDNLPDAVAGAASGLAIVGSNMGSVTSVSGAVGSVTGNVGGNVVGSIGSLATQAKADVNAEADTALADVGVTSTVTGRIDATVSSRASQASVDTIDDYVDTEVAAIKAKTDNLPASPASTGDVTAARDSVLADTDDIQARLPAALTGAGNLKADAQVVSDKTGYALTAAYDASKTAAQAGDAMTLTAGERTTVAGTIWDRLTSAITTVGSIGKLIKDYLDAAISSRSTYDGSDTAGTATLLGRLSALRAAALDLLDVAVSTRLAAADYDAPDNTDIVAIKAKTDNLPASPAATGDVTSARDAVTDVLGVPVHGSIAEDIAAVSIDLGPVLDELDDIKARTDMISAGDISIQSPFNPQTSKLTLTRGDDYPIDQIGRIPAFASLDWPSLENAEEVRMTVRRNGPTVKSADPVLFTLLDVADERVVGGGEQSVTFAPMSALNAGGDQEGSTDDLVPGLYTAKWDIQATLEDGTIRTLAKGLMDVIEDETRP